MWQLWPGLSRRGGKIISGGLPEGGENATLTLILFLPSLCINCFSSAQSLRINTHRVSQTPFSLSPLRTVKSRFNHVFFTLLHRDSSVHWR